MGLNIGNIAKAFGNKKNGTTTKAPTQVTGTVVNSSPTQVTGTVVSSAPKAGVAAPASQPSTNPSSPYSYMSTTNFKAPPSTPPSTGNGQTSVLRGASFNAANYKKPPTTTPTWSRADIEQPSAPPKAPVQVSGTVVTPKVTNVSGTVVNNKSSAPPQYTGGTIGNTPLMAGALNYATADKAGRQQIVANQARIKSDPSYVNSEIGRTLQVIQDRKARGEDVSAQAKYLYTNLGYQGSIDGNVNQSDNNRGNYALTTEQLEAMARAELDAQLAQLQAQAEQQKSALQAQYDYANGITQDNRILENLQFDRVNAPTNWDGSTGYRGAMLDRNRSIQDTQSQLSLQSALAAADQQVADFQSQMPALIRARTGELTQQERAYYLDSANTFGTSSDGRQTFQAQDADRNYGLNYANTYGVSQDGTRQSAQYQSQLFNQGMDINEMTGVYIEPTARNLVNQIISLKRQAETKGITAQQRAVLSQQSDALRAQLPASVDSSLFGSNVSAAQAVENLNKIGTPTQNAYQFNENMAYNRERDAVSDAQWNLSFEYQSVRDAIGDSQWQAQFDQNVLQFGMNYALQKLSEENQSAYQNAMLAINKDENSRAWLNYENDLNQPTDSTYNGVTANQVYSALQSQFVNKETGKIPNDSRTKEQIYLQVMSTALPDGQDTQVMSMLGLTQSDINKYDKQYEVVSGNLNSSSTFVPPSGGAYTNYYKAEKDSKANPKNYATANSAVSRAISTLGYPSDWLAPTLELVARESSFNPNAKNPKSSASGLFQFLDSTRKSYGGSGVDWTDPYQQALKGLQYIEDRYGNPVKALQFWDKNNWY